MEDPKRKPKPREGQMVKGISPRGQRDRMSCVFWVHDELWYGGRDGQLGRRLPKPRVFSVVTEGLGMSYVLAG